MTPINHLLTICFRLAEKGVEQSRVTDIERGGIDDQSGAERKLDNKLEAYIERRKRLWAQVSNANPSYTEDQIVARLEQFGT